MDPKKEYAQAFDDEMAIEAGEITEDDVASEGLIPDELEAEAPEMAAEAAEEGETVTEEAGEEMAEGAEEAPEVTAEAAPAAPTPDIEKEIQRLKSWEGRLKAREAELKAREAGAAGGDAPAGDAAQAVEQVADAVASGQPMDDALAQIEADFGPEFVQALTALVSAQAARVVDEKVGAVNSDVASLIDALKNDKQREHFEYIAEKHADFMEVGSSPEFQEWVKQKGEEAQNIVNVGSARQVCALLDEFKKGSNKGDPAEEGAVSVPSRSGGLRLPAKPASSDDYLSAWEDA